MVRSMAQSISRAASGSMRSVAKTRLTSALFQARSRKVSGTRKRRMRVRRRARAQLRRRVWASR